VDAWGNIYVACDGDRIYVVDQAGSWRGTLDWPADPLNNPTGLVAVGLDLLIADTSNNRIVRFTQSGINTYSYSPAPVTTLAYAPYGLAMDAGGRFYVSSETLNAFGVYDPGFNPLSDWCSNPQLDVVFGIAVDGNGGIYIANTLDGTVFRVRSCFSQPSAPDCLPSYTGSDPPGGGDAFLHPSPVRGPLARVTYRMAGPGEMELRIWNHNGDLAAKVTDRKPAGVQVTPLDLAGFATGVYFYALTFRYDSGAIEKVPTKKFAVVH
jgi:hypothetical protein